MMFRAITPSNDCVLLTVGAVVGAAMGTVFFSVFNRWRSGHSFALAGLASAIVNIVAGQLLFNHVDLTSELAYPNAQGIARIGYWLGLGASLLILNFHSYRSNSSYRTLLTILMSDNELDVLILSHKFKLNKRAIAQLLDLDGASQVSKLLDEGLRRFGQGREEMLRELFKRTPCRVPEWKIRRAARPRQQKASNSSDPPLPKKSAELEDPGRLGRKPADPCPGPG